MNFSSKRSKKKSAGFIISLELLLVLALVVLPLILGMFMLGRKLVTLYLNQVALIEQPLSRPVVWDSSNIGGNAKPVGAVISYDQFGAPQILYRDASDPFDSGNFQPGVLLGVRPNRFTTRSTVWYQQDNCAAGATYVKVSDPSVAPGSDIDFLAQLQGVNHAVGNGNALWRETVPAAANYPGFQASVRSVWVSQNTGDASPQSGSLGFACMATAAGATGLSASHSNLTCIGGGQSCVNLPGGCNPAFPVGGGVACTSVQCTETFACAGGQTATVTLNVGGYAVSVGDSITTLFPSAGAPSPFNTGTVVATTTGPPTTTFTYTTSLVNSTSTCTTAFPGVCAPPDPGMPTGNGTVTFTGIVSNLAVATCVANLGDATPCGGAANFTRPFRLAFPSAVPLAGPVGGVGGG